MKLMIIYRYTGRSESSNDHKPSGDCKDSPASGGRDHQQS